MTKRYVRIKWSHSKPGEPVEFYYELGDGQWASRGVEVFAGGYSTRVSYKLREAPVPAIDWINQDPQLQGEEITAEEFEVAWLELMPC